MFSECINLRSNNIVGGIVKNLTFSIGLADTLDKYNSSTGDKRLKNKCK